MVVYPSSGPELVGGLGRGASSVVGLWGGGGWGRGSGCRSTGISFLYSRVWHGKASLSVVSCMGISESWLKAGHARL